MKIQKEDAKKYCEVIVNAEPEIFIGKEYRLINVYPVKKKVNGQETNDVIGYSYLISVLGGKVYVKILGSLQLEIDSSRNKKVVFDNLKPAAYACAVPYSKNGENRAFVEYHLTLTADAIRVAKENRHEKM